MGGYGGRAGGSGRQGAQCRLKAVKDSKLAKELDTAKDQLKQGIDGAGQTLRDTDGKVADNATRDNLAKAIDEANNTLSKKGVTDPKAYTDAKAKLDAAVRQVTDSKAAKEQADAEAAAQAQAQAQAARAQAAAAAAQSQRSYSQSYNCYGGFQPRVFLQRLQPWVFHPAAILHALQQRRLLRWFQPCRSDRCRFRSPWLPIVHARLLSHRTLASFLLSSSPCLTPPLH